MTTSQSMDFSRSKRRVMMRTIFQNKAVAFLVMIGFLVVVNVIAYNVFGTTQTCTYEGSNFANVHTSCGNFKNSVMMLGSDMEKGHQYKITSVGPRLPFSYPVIYTAEKVS